jgi:hypothetical protein
MTTRSVTKVEEKELVRWAFGLHGMAPWLIPWLFGGVDHFAELEVGVPVLTRGQRQSDELDILFWPVDDVSRAIAIEVKLARIDGDTLATTQVGGLSNIRQGAKQCMAHVARGFHAVYLAVFVKVDARTFSGGYWQGGMLPSPLLHAVRESIRASAPDPDVGILVFQLTQPVDKDVLMGGNLGLLDSRPAVTRSQNQDLTRRMRELAADASRSGRINVPWM